MEVGQCYLKGKYVTYVTSIYKPYVDVEQCYLDSSRGVEISRIRMSISLFEKSFRCARLIDSSIYFQICKILKVNYIVCLNFAKNKLHKEIDINLSINLSNECYYISEKALLKFSIEKTIQNIPEEIQTEFRNLIQKPHDSIRDIWKKL